MPSRAGAAVRPGGASSERLAPPARQV